MQIYVDQSGKVEYTSQDTVIAYSNAKRKSLVIRAEEKRKIQQMFREAGKPTIFAFKTFALLVYLLIRDDVMDIGTVMIDREYVGKEWLVKQVLLQLLRKHGVSIDKGAIDFCHIGKKHKAHMRALSVFHGEITPDMVVTSRDVLPYVL
ncbi:hypothetical protein A3I42_02595 [Candidatus Uhrbacteria bacterium RIFCSPLOWO2_02_FULL_49_11]|uniref:Uncharacterized protein n=1 Tax=Candidatus Uhrbacteria bacterium RIFCSPLOWO2_02_FULL_49_11 TaxID=1802409 RepID=A0A1F7VBA4_9BACT|nr:MAG: hypothetical protein A3I42_02595 [Candidatus Uhrbacteria bacterium RIFCSPLOWO2_02_FULL_49_11]